MNEEKTIFIGSGLEFKEEFEKLAHKYGIPAYLLIFREDYDGKQYAYHFFRSELDSDFIEYVEEKTEEMNDELDS